MAQILKLPPEIAGKIAAGEVIENPLSVVKELVENSLDAGAERVEVRLEEGGRRLIEVKDDGEGMAPEELSLAVERHATSKIREVEDLETVATLGFRGEALASVAEISRLSLLSTKRGNSSCYGIEVEGGHLLKGPEEQPFMRGTRLRVEDLFYNLPARRHFLRSIATEGRSVSSFLRSMALAYPTVGFSLHSDGREVFFYEPVEDPGNRFFQVYGREPWYRFFRPHQDERGNLGLEGFFLKPGLEEERRLPQVLFVNRRLVREKCSIQAVYSAYETFLKKGVKPGYVLFLSVPHSQVEVNIHPTKAEVKFRETDRIFSFLRSSLRLFLEGRAAEGISPEEASAESFTPSLSKPLSSSGSGSLGYREPSPREGEETRSPKGQGPEPSLFPSPGPLFRVIGQYRESYILIEKGGDLVVVDQHNADERVRYDRLSNGEGRSEKRSPLFPIILEVDGCEDREERLAKLEPWGWEVEAWGERSVVVKAFPVEMDPAGVGEFRREYLEGDGKGEAPREDLLKMMACKGAIKVNHPLTLQEMENLVGSLLVSSNPLFCPHGRPILFTLSEEDVRRPLQRK